MNTRSSDWASEIRKCRELDGAECVRRTRLDIVLAACTWTEANSVQPFENHWFTSITILDVAYQIQIALDKRLSPIPERARNAVAPTMPHGSPPMPVNMLKIDGYGRISG